MLGRSFKQVLQPPSAESTVIDLTKNRPKATISGGLGNQMGSIRVVKQPNSNLTYL